MDWEILAQRNIQAVIDAVQDRREVQRDYRWLQRVRPVPALDEELFGKFTGRVIIADIISEDGKAVVRTLPKVSTEKYNSPILKHGLAFSRSQLQMINRIEQNLATRREVSFFEDVIVNSTIDLIDGVKARQEMLICAMLQDTLSYNKLGIIFSGLTWGMPSALKVTVATAWSDAANATPVTDIQTVNSDAQQQYGFMYNRMSLSMVNFREMISTTQFRNLAQLLFPNGSYANIPAVDTDRQLGIASTILGMTIEIDDRTYDVENNDGSLTTTRYVANDKVILSNTQFDGDTRAWDLGNAVLEESMPGMVPSMIGPPEQEMEGPFGYATAADPEGNPPGMNLWAAAKSFPRKKRETVNAVLTV